MESCSYNFCKSLDLWESIHKNECTIRLIMLGSHSARRLFSSCNDSGLKSMITNYYIELANMDWDIYLAKPTIIHLDYLTLAFQLAYNKFLITQMVCKTLQHNHSWPHQCRCSSCMFHRYIGVGLSYSVLPAPSNKNIDDSLLVVPWNT